MTKHPKPKRRCLTIEFAKENGEVWIKGSLKRVGTQSGYLNHLPLLFELRKLRLKYFADHRQLYQRFDIRKDYHNHK